jgi:hypothetical protein
VRSDVFEDVLPTTYSYEFCIKPYPLWAGIESTDREYKKRQMKVLGPDVALVRCFIASHRLFLTVGGAIRDSPSTHWEEAYAKRVSMAQLLPAALFNDLAPVPGRPPFPTPPRDINTDPRFIDLSNFYVASLDKPWVWRNWPHRNISALPRGVVKLDFVSVPFDIRGLIQLIQVGSDNMVAAPFPARVDDISIRQNCRRVHFLEGAAALASVSRGTEIGHYQIHYRDGGREKVSIVYGRDVLTTWQRDETNSLSGRLAWENAVRDGSGASLYARLYHKVWTNPRPEVTIEAIDFVSAMTASAPYLIAITLE